MIEYVIEKGVPLPDLGNARHASRHRTPSSLAATFLKMEKGDSILTTKTLQAISLAALRCGVDVTSRREGAAYRIWRTS